MVLRKLTDGLTLKSNHQKKQIITNLKYPIVLQFLVICEVSIPRTLESFLEETKPITLVLFMGPQTSAKWNLTMQKSNLKK